MTPVPQKSVGGAALKTPFDKVQPEKPLKVTIRAKSKEDANYREHKLRGLVTRWGQRHGIRLVVRKMAETRGGKVVKLEVHHDGARSVK